MPISKKPSPFDLKASALDGTHAHVKSYEDLAIWLSNELDFGISARVHSQEDIRYAWTLYEQGRTRGSNAPWPDAADLTSPFAAEFVDALHADAMQTIFVEPVCIVEGWGESAQRAPFVEEFHQRTQEDERLQQFLDQTILRAFVEGCGTLEVSEAIDMRRDRKRMRAQLQLDETTQAPVMGEDLQPQIQRDQQGNPVETQDPNAASAEVEVDVVEPVRMGPDYDVVPYLDFLQLPSHARMRSQVWGYAKRFFRRVPELLARADQGVYDADAVRACGEEDERNNTTGLDAPHQPIVVEQQGPTAQKELWEVSFRADLDGKGERWWRATVHRDKRILLRLKVDDHTTRYIRFVPFPKPGSLEGYSLILHKMLTVIEEDTAVRNMRADKAALSIAAPIKKLQGSLWDPFEQPFGPKAVIDVRDMGEVQQMVLSDVPQSINVWKQDIRVDAERLIGRNDVSMGTTSQERRTLGEVKLTAMNASVRTSVIVKRFQEAIEELYQARHTIWKRTLAGGANGMPMPQSLVIGLEARGIDVSSIVDGRITPDMLDGQFWFKPHGSTDTADLGAQANNFFEFMKVIPLLMQMNPAYAALMRSPQAAKALLEQALRVTRWPDKQAFLGSEAYGAMTSAQQVSDQQAQHQQMLQDPRMQLLMHLASGGEGLPPGATGQPGMPAGAPQGQPQAAPAPPPDHTLEIAKMQVDKEIKLQTMRDATAIEVAKIGAMKAVTSDLIGHNEAVALQESDQRHQLMTQALQPPPPPVAPPTAGAA